MLVEQYNWVDCLNRSVFMIVLMRSEGEAEWRFLLLAVNMMIFADGRDKTPIRYLK